MNYPLGWIPFHARTGDMDDAHNAALRNMRPMFQLAGEPDRDPGPFVNLMSTWSDPAVVKAIGFEYPGVHQLTGSCVGAGGGNAIFTLQCVEVLLKGDVNQLFVPFWLHPYGISRMLIGETSEGEGSLGSAFAEAAKRGCYAQKENGLPTFENNDGLTWGDRVELKWSNGKAIESKWVDLAKRSPVKRTDPVKSSKDARDAIRNGYPLTFASPWYMNPGSESVKGSKEPACVGALTGNGGHQTSILAVWDHPELGLLFWNENQWGMKTYKECPAMKRRAGCWMTERDMEKVCRSGDGEVYAFGQYEDDYRTQSLPWASILPFTK